MPIQLPPSAGGGTYPDWQACLVSCPPYEKFLATALAFQVKKSNKWNCKMCNEKQSVIKVSGRALVLSIKPPHNFNAWLAWGDLVNILYSIS